MKKCVTGLTGTNSGQLRPYQPKPLGVARGVGGVLGAGAIDAEILTEKGAINDTVSAINMVDEKAVACGIA